MDEAVCDASPIASGRVSEGEALATAQAALRAIKFPVLGDCGKEVEDVAAAADNKDTGVMEKDGSALLHGGVWEGCSRDSFMAGTLVGSLNSSEEEAA